MNEYFLWRKDDDLGWHIVKSSFNVKDFDAEDVWYFIHLITEGTDTLRVGGTRYEINWRAV